MNAKSNRTRGIAGVGVALFALSLAITLTAFPQASPQAFGRTGPSIDAAKAPSFAARRAKLMDIHKDGVIVIPSQFKGRNGAMTDNLNFVYLTGLKEADATLVLDPGGSPRETIFRRMAAGGPPGVRGTTGLAGRSGDPEGLAPVSQATAGQAHGQEPTIPDSGIVEKPSTQISATLFGLVRSGRGKRVYIPFSDFDFLIRTFGQMGAVSPFFQSDTLVNVDPTLSELRLTKDAEEIAALREAIDLTAEALNEAFRAAEPKMREVDLAAILRYAFDRGETEDSFLQAASGPNSTNVHFGATSRPLAAGDLVVFDVGCWVRGYTSDISRTIPASGRFTREQREIYALVLEAEKEGIRRLVPGATFKAAQTAAEDVLMAGLEKLGLVTDIENAWQRRLYIQHGFGHGIGLEVHDVWSWHSPRLDKVVMAQGMVMTMEPGLYFPEGRLEALLGGLKGKVPEADIAAFRDKVGPVYKKYAGMGVRIEDDVLITGTGNEILSGRVPKEVADIEKLMREKSAFNLIK